MMAQEITTIQLKPDTRDKLFRRKFRKSYDTFLNELIDLYDQAETKKEVK